MERLNAPAYRACERALALSPGARVLEIGCGTGTFLECPASREPALLAGVDPAPLMVATARALFEVEGFRPREGGATGIACFTRP